MVNSRTSEGDSGTHYNAWCKLGCGLIAAAPRATCVNMVTQHFLLKHPDEMVVIQGEHFTMMPAAGRCDVCNVISEPPFWTRIIAPGTVIGEIGDDDGLWLVCDPCEQLLLVQDWDALWARWVQQALYEAPHIIAQPKQFWVDARNYQITALTLLRQGAVSGPEGVGRPD